MKKVFILLTCCVFLFSACEEQMVVIPELTGTTSDRKVIIEEFTGVQCSACPQGAAAIKDLQTIYPGNVIAVGVHTNVFGSLTEPYSDSKYDFRTSYGDDLIGYLEPVWSIPAASINRTTFPGENVAVASLTAWAGFVAAELEKEPELAFSTSATFDSNTRKLTVKGNIIPAKRIEGDIKIVGYITENHIIDKQLDGTEKIDNYEHEHVLRDLLAWPGLETKTVEGYSLSSPMEEQAIIEFEFDTFDVPEEDGIWKAENCSVVVFITRFNEDTGVGEVLQADEVDFIQ